MQLHAFCTIQPPAQPDDRLGRFLKTNCPVESTTIAEMSQVVATIHLQSIRRKSWLIPSALGQDSPSMGLGFFGRSTGLSPLSTGKRVPQCVAMLGVVRMSLDLGSMSGAELVVSLRAGKITPVDLVAHLANRQLSAGELLPTVTALPEEYQQPVLLAQMALAQKKPAAEKKSPVRATVSESGKRIVIVRADVDGAYTMTNPPASWLWILDHAAEIRTACDEAGKISDADVARVVADKVMAKAKASAK